MTDEYYENWQADIEERVYKLESENVKLKNYIKKLDKVKKRNKLYRDCLHRAQKLYYEKHPEANGILDGAENIEWLIEQIKTLDSTKLKAERKLEEENIEDALESRISELKAKIDNWQDCYCEFETIAPDGNLKISVLDLYNRLTECEARVAELEVENEKLKATQKWVSVEDELPKEDYVESGATYDLVVQYVDQPAFVIVANYYNKLWCDACTDDWVWIPNEFAKFWRERPLPPC